MNRLNRPVNAAISAFLMGVVFLAGCSAPTPPTQRPLLRLAGSNTIGSELAVEMAKGFLTKELRATEIGVKKLGDDELAVTGRIDGKLVRIVISSHGTSTGLDSLRHGRTDIWMASRQVTAKEEQDLPYKLQTPENEHVVALDGVAIIVHPTNPISQLSKQDVMRIFCSELTNWKQLGGPDAVIQRYVRDDNSGTYETFRMLVLQPYGKENLSPGARTFSENSTLSERLSHDPAGIGFVSHAQVAPNKSLAIYEGDAQAFRPDVFSIKTEDYPLRRRLYMYLPGKQTTDTARKFIRYVTSNEGQNLVAKTGLVSLQISEQGSESLPQNAPAAYRSAVQSAIRLPVNIRFKPSSIQLENKALADLGNLVELLKRDEYKNRRVVLIGFSDNQGNAENNLNMSKARAETVQKYLLEYGNLDSDIWWFGDAAPVADNGTFEGRNKNCRVEVWLR